jgi:general secretion pathway protein K
MNPAKPLKNQSGAALLITLSIITLLMAVTFDLNRRVRLDLDTAEHHRTRARLLELADSGTAAARALLLRDALDSAADTLQEPWADPDACLEVLASLELDPARVRITITDELGKIQVNALVRSFPGNAVNPDQKQVWENLLAVLIPDDRSSEDQDPAAVLNSLIDWLDSGDEDTVSGISGAEADYYASLDPPYHIANGPFQELNEIYMVKGITPDLLDPGMLPEDLLPEDLLPENLEPDRKDPATAYTLSDLFTVHGAAPQTPVPMARQGRPLIFSGKININTAPVPVIAAILPMGRQDLARRIADYRTLRTEDGSGFVNDLTRRDWYALAAGLTSGEKAHMDRHITHQSHIFTITATANLSGRTLVMDTVVARQKDTDGTWRCPVLRQTVR